MRETNKGTVLRLEFSLRTLLMKKGISISGKGKNTDKCVCTFLLLRWKIRYIRGLKVELERVKKSRSPLKTGKTEAGPKQGHRILDWILT